MEKVIKSAKSFGDGFDTANGTLFNHYYYFEDGSEGLAFGKQQETTFKDGDTVEVIDTGKVTGKGKPKIKVKKPDTGHSGGSTGGSSGPTSQTGAPAKTSKEYDPLPGFCNTQLYPAIKLVQDDNGEPTYTEQQVIDKLQELHKLHDLSVKAIRATQA